MTSGSSSSSSNKRSREDIGLSEAEKARYDRQIRVWGAEAQERIQSSHVLICGARGINMEALKNIVLAGMSVCVQDSGVVTAGDLASGGFFLRADDVGKDMVDAALARIQELNTFANVTGEKRPLRELDEAFYRGFNVISVADASEEDVLRINSICRHSSRDNNNNSAEQKEQKQHITMMASWTFGQEGAFLSDFGAHFQFKEDERRDYTPLLKALAFPNMRETLRIPWSNLQKGKFLPQLGAFVKAAILAKWANQPGSSVEEELATASSAMEANGLAADFLTVEDLTSLQKVRGMASATVVSILGAFLAQEIVKGVSRVGEPAYNTHVFNKKDLCVQVYPMCDTMTAPVSVAQNKAAVEDVPVDNMIEL